MSLILQLNRKEKRLYRRLSVQSLSFCYACSAVPQRYVAGDVLCLPTGSVHAAQREEKAWMCVGRCRQRTSWGPITSSCPPLALQRPLQQRQEHWCGKHHSLCCACCVPGEHHCACYHPSAQTNVLCTTPAWPTCLAASVANLNVQTSAYTVQWGA